MKLVYCRVWCSVVAQNGEMVNSVGGFTHDGVDKWNWKTIWKWFDGKQTLTGWGESIVDES